MHFYATGGYLVDVTSKRRRVARALREARRTAKLSQKRLGELAGVYRDTVGNIEREETDPEDETLRKLGDYLGIDLLLPEDTAESGLDYAIELIQQRYDALEVDDRLIFTGQLLTWLNREWPMSTTA